jgi:hypothetical protein
MRGIIAYTALAVGLLLSSGAMARASSLPIVAEPPAPVISTAPATPGDTIRQALARNEIPYANVWADDKGRTHITKCVLKGLQLHGFAPPAAPYFMGMVGVLVAERTLGVGVIQSAYDRLEPLAVPLEKLATVVTGHVGASQASATADARSFFGVEDGCRRLGRPTGTRCRLAGFSVREGSMPRPLEHNLI